MKLSIIFKLNTKNSLIKSFNYFNRHINVYNFSWFPLDKKEPSPLKYQTDNKSNKIKVHCACASPENDLLEPDVYDQIKIKNEKKK